MKEEKILDLSLNDLFTMFGKGRFASVTFEKKDGSIRTLTGKTQVNKGINGNGATYDPSERNQLRIFDVNIKDNDGMRVGGWRTVTADKVLSVKANKTHYVIC